MAASKSVLRAIFLLISIGLVACAHTGQERPRYGSVVAGSKGTPGYFLANHFGDDVALVSTTGETVRTWKFSSRVFTAQLLPGDQIGAIVGASDRRSFVWGRFEVRDAENALVWAFEDGRVNHDFEPLPNGNVVLIRTSAALAKGFRSKRVASKGPYVCSDLIEVNPRGDVVWSLELAPLLDFAALEEELDPRPLSQTDPTLSLCHANSVRWIAKHPFATEPALLLSLRNANRVVLVGRESKKILWMSKPGDFRRQHDARMDEQGLVTAFDNGDPYDFLVATSKPPSGVVTVDTRSGTRRSVTTGPEAPFGWRSPYLSGVQWIGPGRLWVSLAFHGQIVEYDVEKGVVWRFVASSPELGNTTNLFFRAPFYRPDQVPAAFLRP